MQCHIHQQYQHRLGYHALTWRCQQYSHLRVMNATGYKYISAAWRIATMQKQLQPAFAPAIKERLAIMSECTSALQPRITSLFV